MRPSRSMIAYHLGSSLFFFFSSRRRHTRSLCDWSSDVCSSDLDFRLVAEYGTVTRGVQIFGTPTTLVIGDGGQTKVVTGLTDEYSLRQAIKIGRASCRERV